MKIHHVAAKRPLFLIVLIWAVAMSTPLLAGDLVVTRYFSGLWDQPRQGTRASCCRSSIRMKR